MSEAPHSSEEVRSAEDVAEKMRSLVDYLVRLLVTDRDSVSIEASDQDGAIVLDVRVGADDLGRVIGRRGKTVRALRTVTQAAASRQGARTMVEIVS